MADPIPRRSAPRRYLAEDTSRQRRIDALRARERRDREEMARPSRDGLEEAAETD